MLIITFVFLVKFFESRDFSRPFGFRDQDETIELLVEKAEGVFLWMCLAVQDINRGLELGDRPELLRKRIDAIPSDLIRLYQDMWERMNGDKDIYRQSASLYLKLAMAKNSQRRDLNILEMMFAFTQSFDQVLRDDFETHPKDLIMDCERTIQEVKSRCAGLLEVRENTPYVGFECIAWNGWDEETFDTLIPFVSNQLEICLVHRTAYDFLTDTSDGQNLMSHDLNTESQISVRIEKAFLASFQLFFKRGRTPRSFLAVANGGENCQTALSCVSDAQGEFEDLQEIFATYEMLCNRGRLYSCFTGRPYFGSDFLCQVTGNRSESIGHCMLAIVQARELSSEALSWILLNTLHNDGTGPYSFLDLAHQP